MDDHRYYKAQAIGDRIVDSVRIILETEVPHVPYPESIETQRTYYEDDAVLLERVLNSTLPGGTYDALLRCMLNRRASYLAVPFAFAG